MRVTMQTLVQMTTTSLLNIKIFISLINEQTIELPIGTSVTRLDDLLEFGQLFKAFGNN